MSTETTDDPMQKLIDGKREFDALKGRIDDYLHDNIPGIVKSRIEQRKSDLGISPAVERLIDVAMERSGNSAESVFLKSLALFITALGAEQQGHRVAVLDPDDTIVDYITDIRSPDEAVRHAFR